MNKNVTLSNFLLVLKIAHIEGCEGSDRTSDLTFFALQNLKA